jgi:carbon monoxide dehydrogenase subunit G
VLIENEFTASAPVDELWAFLLDVQRIAPCMPGAELTEVVDDKNWKGRMTMKFGPVGMAFAGTVTMQERDDAAHRVVLSAKGTEQKGKGAASASVTSWLEPRDDGSSLVKMQADISLTGAVAQLSRGLLPEVSKKLTQQFADCLEQTLAASQEPASSPPAAPGPGPASTTATEPAETRTFESPPTTPAPMAAKPVGGIGLGLSALWAVVTNFFRRLFGGARSA